MKLQFNITELDKELFKVNKAKKFRIKVYDVIDKVSLSINSLNHNSSKSIVDTLFKSGIKCEILKGKIYNKILKSYYKGISIKFTYDANHYRIIFVPLTKEEFKRLDYTIDEDYGLLYVETFSHEDGYRSVSSWEIKENNYE